MTNLVTDKSTGRIEKNTQTLLGESNEDWFNENTPLLKEFRNPSSEQPMRASEFLQFFDTKPLEPVVREGFKREPVYSIKAFTKSIIHRKLLGIHSYSQHDRFLETHPQDAKELGFKEQDGTVKTPDHETMRELEKERLGPNGVARLRRKVCEILIATAKALGLHIGCNVGQDSTPLQARPKDSEAAYNGHYKKIMYKVHVATDLDYDLPLSDKTTGGLEYDGHHLQDRLSELRDCGAKIKHVYGDQHYGAFENRAFVACQLSATGHFRLAVDDAHNESGSMEELRRVYQTLWQKEGFKQNATDLEILNFLYRHGEGVRVGTYFRNQAVDEREECPDGFHESLNARTHCEGQNGHWKEQLDFERSFRKKGLVNAAVHASGTCLTVLVVALVRLQHGITCGLSRLAGLT